MPFAIDGERDFALVGRRAEKAADHLVGAHLRRDVADDPAAVFHRHGKVVPEEERDLPGALADHLLLLAGERMFDDDGLLLGLLDGALALGLSCRLLLLLTPLFLFALLFLLPLQALALSLAHAAPLLARLLPPGHGEGELLLKLFAVRVQIALQLLVSLLDLRGLLVAILRRHRRRVLPDVHRQTADLSDALMVVGRQREVRNRLRRKVDEDRLGRSRRRHRDFELRWCGRRSIRGRCRVCGQRNGGRLTPRRWIRRNGIRMGIRRLAFGAVLDGIHERRDVAHRHRQRVGAPRLRQILQRQDRDVGETRVELAADRRQSRVHLPRQPRRFVAVCRFQRLAR